jgi:hypothetical protein
VLVATLVMLPALFGRAFYPADIRYSHPLWYDGVHTTRNYDLIDAYTLFYPNDRFFNEGLKLGQWREWNPEILCGHPVLASGGAGFLYPPRILAHLWLSPTAAHNILLWTHLALAGFCFYLLASRLGLGREGALFAGTLWMLNGYTMTWFETEFSVVYGALSPLVMERLYVAFSQARPRAAPALVAAILMGLLSLAGHTQFWANFMLLFGAWVLYLCWRSRSWRALALAVPVLLLPIAIGSIYLLPILELAARTARPDRPFSHVMNSFLHVALSLPFTMVAPDILGSPVGGFAIKFVSRQGNWLMLESCAYLGVAPLVLALLSYRCREREHWRFFAAAALLLIVVPATPFFYPAYKLIPGFSKMASTRLLFQMVFSLCLLAGYGLDYALGMSRPGLRRVGLVVLGTAGGILTLALCCVWTQAVWPQMWASAARWLVDADLVRYPMANFSTTPQAFPGDVLAAMTRFYGPTSPTFLLPLLWSSLGGLLLVKTARPENRHHLFAGLVILTLLDLGTFAARFNTTCRPDELQETPPALAFLSQNLGAQRVLELGTIRPNTGMLFGVSTLGGQDALPSDRTVSLLGALDSHDNPQAQAFSQVIFPFRSASSPLVHTVGARYVLSYPNVDLSALGFTMVFRQAPQGLAVWENARAHPVLRMAARAVSASNFADALSKTIVAAGDPSTVVLEGPARQGDSTVAPSLLGRTPGHWRIRATGPGWLVLGETYDPGWQAVVDGATVPIARADAAFQAIWLDAGEHAVSWDYSPVRQREGAIISALALLLAVTVLLWCIRRGAV